MRNERRMSGSGRGDEKPPQRCGTALVSYSTSLPFHEAPGTGPLSVAEPGGRRGHDLVGATRLSIRSPLLIPLVFMMTLP